MQLHKTNNVKIKSEWMPCPKIPIEYPGLAYICPLDELIITETRDTLHDVIGDRAGISYTICNNLGQKIFVAIRDNHFKRCTLKVYNIYGNEVIEIKRLFRFCLNSIKVWAPPGHFVGSVDQSFFDKYSVNNCNHEAILKIRSEKINTGLLFYIRYICGVEPIGVIRKYNSGLAVHVKTYGVSFPVQLDVKDKAVLLGACFLIGSLRY